MPSKSPDEHESRSISTDPCASITRNTSSDASCTASVSANDCTGLIPAGLSGDELVEAYRELYPYGAPELPGAPK